MPAPILPWRSSMHLPVFLHLARGLSIVLFLSLVGQSQTAPQQKQNPGTISGIVTIKGKRAPGVVVGLRRAEPGTPFEGMSRTTTDQEGKYRLTNVATGTYDIMASLPAYVAVEQASSLTPTQSGRRVVMGEGENVEDINFDLVRGGVITGKITDADGRPAIQQQVSVYRASSWDQQGPPGAQRPPIFAVASMNTDDRGIYRIFGIAAGRYKVAVGRGDDTFSAPSVFNRSSYKQIFYPDANDQAKATVIELTEGSEATNIDIALGRPVPTFNASGRVVDAEKGLPIPNVRFTVNRVIGEVGPTFGNTAVRTNLQGEFFVDNLTPGKYGFFFIPEANNEQRAEATTFDVLDSDVSGLVVRMTKGETLSGVVALEREDPKGMARLAQLEVRIFISGQSGSAMQRSAISPVASDGSFRFAGLSPGTASFYLADARTRMQVRGVSIVRIERDGAIHPRGIEIKEGEQVGGVRIVVSYGEATLRGNLVFENGTLVPGSFLNVRLTRPGETATVGSTMADARGAFVIEGLPAGVLEATVFLLGPDRKVRRSIKQQVTVQETGVTNVSIKFDLSEPKSP